MSLTDRKHTFTKQSISFLTAIFLILSIASCNLPVNLNTSSPTPTVSAPSATPLPQTETSFIVEIPQDLASGQSVYLDILDEVTGLALNPVRYKLLTIDSRHFGIKLPISIGSVLKYRYALGGTKPAVEYTATGKQVRYRLLDVAGPGVTEQDTVSAWSDLPYSGETGQITGQVLDSASHGPVPNLMVAAAGEQTFTGSDGSFELDGLAPGTHNIVIYALDGAYHTFQQGAVVAANSTTPADISVTAAPLVNVAFLVTVPKENVVGVPLHIAGNLDFLGNTFADLNGGLSTVAARMPVLTLMPDGRYSITLALHAGTDLRYKYTLGDGFWNSEQTSDGKFRIRQLIVPNQNAVIQDTVDTWLTPKSEPISFEVTVPADTPQGDTVSIQFNPFTWTPPIPMWPLGNNRWLYILDNPLNLVGNIGYRYCRNDQCGSADDSATAGPNAKGRTFAVSDKPQSMQDEVKSWQWWSPSSTPTSVVAEQIQARGSAYVAGVEFQNNYNPTWLPRIPETYKELGSIGTNWVYLTPTWTYSDNTHPVFGLTPGSDPLYSDAVQTVSDARTAGFNIALFPSAHFNVSQDQWWATAPRDSAWWEQWFARYKKFAVNFAGMAASSGAGALVLGGDWLAPALPSGKLADGSPSGVPEDASTRWGNIIQSVRDVYKGTLIWAAVYPDGVANPPDFLNQFDQVYVLLSAPIASQPNPTPADLQNDLTSILDSQLQPFQASFGKPLLLGVAFPSAAGSLASCPPAPSGGCLSLDALSRPNADIASIQVDLQAQVDAYNALLVAANSRDWISGLVSRGYYPPAALQDYSTSIHGKPAQDVVWYWYPRLTANP